MKEAYSCVAAVGCSVASQFLYAVIERPSKVSVPPKIAVTTDPVLSKSHRAKRVEERKRDPDGLDSIQKARPHGAAPLPCIRGYRAAALRGKVSM